MNGWYDGATIAARERMKDFRRRAEDARSARTARGDRPAEGGVARARRMAATALHRLADTLAPRSISGSEPARGARDLGGRPVA